jgi:ubiquinone/menaquinone biosynthesis C-methylase UbiE
MTYQTSEACREFDRWSGRYDRDVLQLLFFRPSHRMLLENIRADDRRILDIGCGTGQFAAAVHKRCPQARVYGLDLSGQMLRQGAKRCDGAGGAIQLVQGDSARLPFADDAFDVVTCAHSFHHYPSQSNVLAEMHRVLRPGGRLMIVDGDRDRWWGRILFDGIVVMIEGQVRHLSSRAFRSLYRRTGFDDIRQRRRRGPLPFLLTVGRAAKSAMHPAPGRTRA